MALSMNRFLDPVKQKILQYAGDPGHCQDLQRSGDSYVDFVLSAAQMDTLNATPVTILAAPGAGMVNICKGVFLQVNSTGFTAFSIIAISVRYTDASGAKMVTDVVSTVVSSVTDVMDWCPAIVAAPIANAVTVVTCASDFTAGTGNIQGRMYYKTIKVSEIVA